MKKTILIIAGIMMLFNASVMSQITFEHSYNVYKKDLYVKDIGNNNYKYVIFDSSGFSLYNLDYSAYLLNVVPPIPVWQPPVYYEISYISNTLFDCDSNNIEYVISRGGYPSNFYIYRSDGTLLFEKDSAVGCYNIGAFGGSEIIQPIVNTPAGTKLFLIDNKVQYLTTNTEYIYSLCGSLPESISEIPHDNIYVKVYPNPTDGIINFQIDQPNNYDKFRLTIYNTSFKKVLETVIDEKDFQLNINQKQLPSGVYLFDLRTDKKVYQTGKFIITK
ncbi:MAG: T9SS type A sorting domain-containing protein [Bacteroidota bacterium]